MRVNDPAYDYELEGWNPGGVEAEIFIIESLVEHIKELIVTAAVDRKGKTMFMDALDNCIRENATSDSFVYISDLEEMIDRLEQKQ